MIKDFITSVAGVVFLGTACDMLIPDGNLKKYYKLAIGFIVMSILIKPVGGFFDLSFEFTPVETMSEDEIVAQSNAYILKIHEENIKNEINEICKGKVEVFIELYGDGRVRSIHLKGEGISASDIENVKNKTGCCDITVSDNEY